MDEYCVYGRIDKNVFLFMYVRAVFSDLWFIVRVGSCMNITISVVFKYLQTC